MPIKAVTVDLWGTILYSRDPEEKSKRRRAILLEALLEAGLEVDGETLRSAYRAARLVNEERLRTEYRDLGPAGRWALVLEQLGLPEQAIPFSRVAPAYDDLTLEFRPPLMPGAAAALERLAARYPLGLICNTGHTGGAVLRRVLAEHDLDHLFRMLVFSNEFGWLKPDPRIFHFTLEGLGVRPSEGVHIGDLEAFDVAGARAAGMLSIRYLPDGPAPTEADAVLYHWDQVEAVLDQLRDRSPDS